MYQIYLVALIPAFIGILLFLFTKKVAWIEWLGGVVLSLAIAGIIHGMALWGMLADVETWSGELTEASYHPEWVEQYHVTHNTYDSKGRWTGSYTTTHYRTHTEYWDTYSNIGTLYRVDEAYYNKVCIGFGGNIEITQPHKSGFHSGDRNLYTVHNKKGRIFPVTKQVSFTNRVKAAPTLFSFAKVPEAVDKKLFAYPVNADPFVSDRLLGYAGNSIDKESFDILNAKLGPVKFVNIILIGFVNEDATIAEWQRAKWAGGKKNDLVICYGIKTDPHKAMWCRVFGWTEKEDVKRSLEALVISKPVSNDLLVDIEREVKKSYVIKDWSKFDYITVEPSTALLIWSVCIMLVTQVGFYVFALFNNINSLNDLMDFINNLK